MFWKNLPNETTPRNAENLSRSERYLQAIAGANGDFYVNIDGADGLANGDTLKISFPTATNGTSNARLSIDGGNTYKDITISDVNLLAKHIEDNKLTLIYDGTDWTFPKGTKIKIFDYSHPTLNLGATSGLVWNNSINLGLDITNLPLEISFSTFQLTESITIGSKLIDRLTIGAIGVQGASTAPVVTLFLAARLKLNDSNSNILEYLGNVATRIRYSDGTSETVAQNDADRLVFLSISIVVE